MNNPITQIYGPLYGPRINLLSIIGVIVLMAMLLVFVLDANVQLFLFFNRVSEFTGRDLWANITSLGEGLLVLALAGLVAVRWPAAAWTILIGAIVGSLLVHGLKGAFAVMRPAAVLPVESFHIIGPRLTFVSFPSGHTATITAFATILFLHSKHNFGALALAALVLMVGLSRMAVGAHWPLDVLAGWLVGMIVAVISFSLAERWAFGLKIPAQFSVIALSLICVGALFWLDPYMLETTVLRWVIASIGLVSSAWALVLTVRRNNKPIPETHP